VSLARYTRVVTRSQKRHLKEPQSKALRAQREALWTAVGFSHRFGQPQETKVSLALYGGWSGGELI
jgi:hypothetical protein